MTSRFLDSVSPPISEYNRTDEALRSLRCELDLPDNDRRRRVIWRLRAWLEAPPEEARASIGAFAEARRRLEAAELACLDESEESAVMDGLTYEEFVRLSGLVPWLRRWDPISLPPSESPVQPPSLVAALTWAGKAAAGAT